MRSRRRSTSRESFQIKVYTIPELQNEYQSNPVFKQFINEYVSDYLIKVSNGKYKTFRAYYAYLQRLNAYVKELSNVNKVRILVYWKRENPVGICKVVYYRKGFFDVYPSMNVEFDRLKWNTSPTTIFVYRGNLWIHPSFRGKGFCKPLVSSILRLLHKQLVNYIIISIEDSNTPSKSCNSRMIKTKALEYPNTYFYIGHLYKT